MRLLPAGITAARRFRIAPLSLFTRIGVDNREGLHTTYGCYAKAATGLTPTLLQL